MIVKWFKPEDRLPPDNRAVLCYWKPTTPYSSSYATACYQDNGTWHDPEDDEDDFATPDLWTFIPPLPQGPSHDKA